MNPPLSSAARGASSPGSYRLRPPAPALPLAGILNWQPDDRRHAFQRSALKRIALADFKRNALIAAGNYLATHRDPDLWQRIVALSTDPAEDESVRLTARQTLDRLAANAAQPSF
jgi:epoxyqueuosine reductase QueG